jgi:phenylpropionate dioxygenase-like ring-hydroxylating dioxygenase large terminal subunit
MNAHDFPMKSLATPIDLRRIGSHPDHWYPVAWSEELKSGKTFAAHFAGEPIVLVRPAQGSIFALEDRCAHRQVPLSKGAVDGCIVRCCYHGWGYDASGHCVDVPYLGKGKLPNGVKSYPCFERDGIVFIWPGAAAPAEPFERIGAVANPAYKTRKFGTLVGCHYTFMHENLMDMNHQFLHRKTTGKTLMRYLGRRMGDDWLEVDYNFSRPGNKRPIGEAIMAGSLGKAGMKMTVRTEYPYQTMRVWADDGDPLLNLWLGYTPVDTAQRRTRAFVTFSVRRPKFSASLDLVWPGVVWFTHRVLMEDFAILEMEQIAHNEQGADWNREVFPPINELRDLLRACGIPPSNGSQPANATPALTQ